MALNTRGIPWRLVLAYIFDWIVVAVILAVGGGLSYVTPNARLFSPADARISYPYSKEHVRTSLLFVLCVVIPGIIIAGVIFCFLPVFTISFARLRTGSLWRDKAWELHTGWLGLALANVLALLINQVFKVSFGRPRPDFLDRCRPDLALLPSTTGGGGVTSLLPTQLLLSRSACTVTDKHTIDDGFKAFFSGHAANSFAGLLYLSLWLALKCNIILPLSNRRSPSSSSEGITSHSAADVEQSHTGTASTGSTPRSNSGRYGPSSPPTWGSVLIFAPILLASWITATRFIDYRHGGWDLTAGVLVGTICAVIAFRWFHADPLLGSGDRTFPPRQADEAWLLAPMGGRHGFGGEHHHQLGHGTGHGTGHSTGVSKEARHDGIPVHSRPGTAGTGPTGAGTMGSAEGTLGHNEAGHMTGTGYNHTAPTTHGINGANSGQSVRPVQAGQPVQPYEQA